MTDKPKTLPLEKENYCLRLLCCYLLYERKQQTELGTMVEGLIVERHRQFHDTASEWRSCRNQICVSARMILDQARQPEVELNEFSVQLMQAYTINFQPRVEDRKMLGLKARLVEIAKLVERAQQADPTKPKNEGVIIP